MTAAIVNGDGFAVTESYIIGPDGSTMTELDGSGTWKHTDVPAGLGTMAVYDSSGLHFRFTDWLGSHRVETDYKGTTTPVEDTYQSLPFGELLGSYAGATQKHFTGKEHDDESGLDYFEARYFGSNMGRFISPDWSAKVEPVPYSILADPQSLNLYSYVRNHPISASDPDGHCPQCVLIEQALEEASETPTGKELLGWLGAATAATGAALDNAGGKLASVVQSTDWSHFNYSSTDPIPMRPVGNPTPPPSNTKVPNPDGQNGKKDHRDEVKKAADEHRANAKEGETVLENKRMRGVDSRRQPDVQTVDANGKTVRITEVERHPTYQRNRHREGEYTRLGIPHETRPIPK